MTTWEAPSMTAFAPAAYVAIGMVIGYILARIVDTIRRDAKELGELRARKEQLEKEARERKARSTSSTAQSSVMRASPLASDKRGGCGIQGCPNMRPHSHVKDLARRLKEQK